LLEYDPSREALYSPDRRASLFEHGKQYTAVQIAIEAARLAYIRAEQSAGELERLTASLAGAGFGTPTLFVDVKTGTEAFGTRRAADSTTLIAFRGTQPDATADLLTDAQAFLTPWPESAGLVHAGFAAALRAVLPDLRRWLEREPRGAGKLLLTGHSLGAALATLAASVLQPSLLVTLGSPRVGDAAFAATVTSELVRIVDCCDAVTDLPPAILYCHVGPTTYITHDGEQVLEPSPAFVRTDRLRGRTQYFVDYAWKKGAVMVRDFADHAPLNYARAFFE
jgi:hypothetical protein